MVKFPIIENPKERGEWAELQFMAAAAGHRLRVAKAWGDSARYDVVVESGGRLLRVQVKSTVCRSKSSRRSYVCAVHPNLKTQPYRRWEFDFLAAYVIPEDVWYIIPSRAVVKGNMGMIVLSPGNAKHKYGRYKEAWHLLRRVATLTPKRAH
jgi:PD-(D/E)XK endonuclease